MTTKGPRYQPSPHMRVRRYPVREQHGFIWMWHGGRDELAPAGEPPWFDVLPATEARSATRTLTIAVPYERMLEGLLDIHHAPFAHRGVMPGVGTRLDPFDAHIAADGCTVVARGVLRKEAQAPDKGMPFELQLRFPGLMYGKLLGMDMVVAATPIDAHSSWMIYRYYSNTPILGRLIAWFMVFAEDRFVQIDDKRLQESSTPAQFDRRLNHYVPADAAFLLWHKLYRQALRQEAAPAPLLAKAG